MRIRYSPNFLLTLDRQREYIAKDKPSAARKFKNDVLNECNNLAKCRKSIHYADENIMDLIFKGYTIIYEVSEDTIGIFAFTKYEKYMGGE